MRSGTPGFHRWMIPNINHWTTNFVLSTGVDSVIFQKGPQCDRWPRLNRKVPHETYLSCVETQPWTVQEVSASALRAAAWKDECLFKQVLCIMGLKLLTAHEHGEGKKSQGLGEEGANVGHESKFFVQNFCFWVKLYTCTYQHLLVALIKVSFFNVSVNVCASHGGWVWDGECHMKSFFSTYFLK